MKVGFIGLGTMGASMASNLQAAKHELWVHDVRREVAKPHVDAGAQWKDTPREVAAAVEVVFTSLPGPVEVEAVALGADGLVSGMRKGAAYFDLSTNSPALIRRLHALFKDRGLHLLDAPVSGGPKGARTRKLALWVGGDKEIYDRFKPVLDAIGRIEHADERATAQPIERHEEHRAALTIDIVGLLQKRRFARDPFIQRPRVFRQTERQLANAA